MMKISRSFLVTLALGAIIVGLAGCKKEGPAERAGKEIDKSAEKVGKELGKAGENLKDAIKDMKK